MLIAVVPVEQIGKRQMHLTPLDELNHSAVQIVVHRGLGRRRSGCVCGRSGCNGSLFQAARNVHATHFGSQRRERWDFGHDKIMHFVQVGRDVFDMLDKTSFLSI
jgi:hypothetical protein